MEVLLSFAKLLFGKQCSSTLSSSNLTNSCSKKLENSSCVRSQCFIPEKDITLYQPKLRCKELSDLSIKKFMRQSWIKLNSFWTRSGKMASLYNLIIPLFQWLPILKQSLIMWCELQGSLWEKIMLALESFPSRPVKILDIIRLIVQEHSFSSAPNKLIISQDYIALTLILRINWSSVRLLSGWNWLKIV